MNSIVPPWFEALLLILQGAANLFTAIIGVFTVYQLVFRRKKISEKLERFFNILKGARTTVVVASLRERIVKLRSLDYQSSLESKKAIKALLADVVGQISAMEGAGTKLIGLHDEMKQFLKNWKGFSEVDKNRLVAALEVVLDDMTHQTNSNLVK